MLFATMYIPLRNKMVEKRYNMMVGRVKWFNNEKGYGFIDFKENEDIFVHYSSNTILENYFENIFEHIYINSNSSISLTFFTYI